ncbi:MAG: MBL fold metallo-hydrolase [Lentisphaerota bacterium]
MKALQPIPGLVETRWCAFERKPDATCSNTFLLDAPSCLVIIDPGGGRIQSDAVVEMVRHQLHEMIRPVLIILTHCHRDHSKEVPYLLEQLGNFSCSVLIQEDGAKALETRDGKITLFDLFQEEVPRIEKITRLSPSDDQRIKLGPVDTLEVFFTPGHSPDSLCLRAGNLLFTGDLLVASKPGIAGAPGWSRKDLIGSLHLLSRLLQDQPADICCQGHGNSLAAAIALQRVEESIREAGSLGGIAVLDPARARFLAGYSRMLLKEAEILFPVLSGKVVRLSEYLGQLDEQVMADQLLAAVDMNEIDRVISEFDTFAKIYGQASSLIMAVPLKAVQALGKIERALRALPVADLLSRWDLWRAQFIIQDFINTVQGFDPAQFARPEDLNALLEELIGELKAVPGGDASILAVTEDHPAFVQELVRRWAQHSSFAGISMKISSSQTLPPIQISRDHFRCILGDILECLAMMKAAAAVLRTELKDQVVSLCVEAEKVKAMDFSERKMDYWKQSFAACGCGLRFTEQAKGLLLAVDIPVA